MPRVSIVIPTYNPGTALNDALRSVSDQTYKDWEVLVIDDGSSEDISETVRNFPNTRFMRQPNRGVSVARNVGILNSDSEYIAFLDQDDCWYSSKLDRQVKALDSDQEAALCFTDWQMLHDGMAVADRSESVIRSPAEKPLQDNDPNINSGRILTEVTSYLDLLQGLVLLPSSVMVRRSCLFSSGLFDPLYRLGGGEDCDLWLKLAMRHKILHLKSTETGYRSHVQNTGILHFQFGHQAILEVWSRHINFAKMRGDSQAILSAAKGLKFFRRHYGKIHFDTARSALRQTCARDFIYHFGKALLLNPYYVVSNLLRFPQRRLSKMNERATHV
jgi:glycosyltransferase involved in cell wall biosynthesis